MTIKTAIEKAIEKGFGVERYIGEGDTFETWLKMDAENDLPEIIMRPAFWICLGESLGWKETEYMMGVGKVHAGREHKLIKRKDWLKNWHRLIDHLAEGGSIEDFFKEL